MKNIEVLQLINSKIDRAKVISELNIHSLNNENIKGIFKSCLYINNKYYITPKNLSEYIGVSYNTLNRYINMYKYELLENGLMEINNKGIVYSIIKDNNIDKLRECLCIKNKQTILTKDCIFILLMVLPYNSLSISFRDTILELDII